ncbi:T-box transcription factor mls-1-like [Patella vulgata]|uniref:T-box transcription factor mls-1-like n=1 Tax=Patella vulgata TaxID=6465 RepID=UPI0024A89EEA|nr:T-box transcription factor mls-1-like [Patella vulgata]
MEPNPPVIHHDSPNIGAFWMRKVSFAKVKLTNYKDSNEGSIVLHSMHKYMAKIIIEPAGADGKGLGDRIVIPFDETEFFAVTAYQNETIIQLKIHNNPFAKAFRYPRIS